LLLFLLLGANFVFALEVNYPQVPGVTAPQDFLNDPSIPSEEILSLYIKYIFNLVIWVGGVIALGALIYGGIRYLTSAGKPEAMVSARNQISAAFFGLLLLFSSYLVFQVINPELLILKTPTLVEIEPIEIKYISPPSIKAVYSSIDVELPFGRVIERIFETYISDLPNSVVREPRMERIKENVSTTLEIAEKLKNNSEKLKELAHQCSCQSTEPENPCGGNKGENNTTWKCDCGGCGETLPCTSDPCAKVRSEIEELEQDNLEQIELLKQEQQKTLAEIKDLGIELKRLERTKSFIQYCPGSFENSYAQFLDLKKVYESGGGIVREIRFWDDIIIPYVNKEGRQAPEWATFLCTIGGDILPSTWELYEEEEKKPEEFEFKEEACSIEIPVGEIIDRTIRTARLLIARLEKLVVLDKEIIGAVDEMHVWISQCSSKRGCERRCTCFHCGCGSDPCINLCKGWIYCCADSSPAYSGECKHRDEDKGIPCPYEEIDNQLEKIKNIFERDPDDEEEGIKNVVENPKPDQIEKKERIGIISLIDPDDPNSVVSKILKEMDYIQKLESGIRGIRYPLQICGTESHEGVLLVCKDARGRLGPQGRRIKTCCLEEQVFQDCLEKCYLEVEEQYQICLQECLNQKTEEAEARGVPRAEEIARCRHLLNYFCCEE